MALFWSAPGFVLYSEYFERSSSQLFEYPYTSFILWDDNIFRDYSATDPQMESVLLAMSW